MALRRMVGCVIWCWSCSRRSAAVGEGLLTSLSECSYYAQLSFAITKLPLDVRPRVAAQRTPSRTDCFHRSASPSPGTPSSPPPSPLPSLSVAFPQQSPSLSRTSSTSDFRCSTTLRRCTRRLEHKAGGATQTGSRLALRHSRWVRFLGAQVGADGFASERSGDSRASPHSAPSPPTRAFWPRPTVSGSNAQVNQGSPRCVPCSGAGGVLAESRDGLVISFLAFESDTEPTLRRRTEEWNDREAGCQGLGVLRRRCSFCLRCERRERSLAAVQLSAGALCAPRLRSRD